MNERLLLGVDGGGTSTSALLARLDSDGWSALGRGEAGPGNLTVAGTELGLANLDLAISAAFQQAERPPQSVQYACFAMAGSDRDSVRHALDQWAGQQSVAAHWIVVHDAEPVLVGAGPDENAVALIAGTGSIAWGRNSQGQTARAGGWGPLLGDEGSGYWVGLQALRAALLATDHRGPATRLSDSITEQIAIDDLNQLPLAVKALSRVQIAALTHTVQEAADAGDAVAVQILAGAGRHLAELVVALASRLEMHHVVDRLAITGGVLLNVPRVLDHVCTRLREVGCQVAAVDRVADPASGAVELARRATLR